MIQIIIAETATTHKALENEQKRLELEKSKSLEDGLQEVKIQTSENGMLLN